MKTRSDQTKYAKIKCEVFEGIRAGSASMRQVRALERVEGCWLPSRLALKKRATHSSWSLYQPPSVSLSPISTLFFTEEQAPKKRSATGSGRLTPDSLHSTPFLAPLAQAWGPQHTKAVTQVPTQAHMRRECKPKWSPLLPPVIVDARVELYGSFRSDRGFVPAQSAMDVGEVGHCQIAASGP